MTSFLYEYCGEDHIGRPIFSCRRKGGGICAYGNSYSEALANFKQSENEAAPLPKSQQVFSSPFEPPEFTDKVQNRDEDYL